MSKEKFNWKGLFINDENKPKDVAVQEPVESAPSTSNSFPDTSKPISKFPDSTPKATNVNVDSAVLNTIIEMYESGFESLNKPGYDFYEFFKAIKAVGSNDPSIYKMALTMATSVDTKVTKETLLTQANFYIEEIEKVHKKYEVQGNAKRTDILNNQKSQKNSLRTEISSLEKQLLEIQNQISIKKNKLLSVDTDVAYISEIDEKIIANDTAKSKILETIVTVVDGIKNNL